jgi:hypothetical protein
MATANRKGGGAGRTETHALDFGDLDDQHCIPTRKLKEVTDLHGDQLGRMHLLELHATQVAPQRRRSIPPDPGRS